MSWDRHAGFSTGFSFAWRGHQVKVNIRSWIDNAPYGHRAHFNFNIDGMNSHYNMLDSYMKGVEGQKPRVTSDAHELVFEIVPTSMRIIEVEKQQ